MIRMIDFTVRKSRRKNRKLIYIPIYEDIGKGGSFKYEAPNTIKSYEMEFCCRKLA